MQFRNANKEDMPRIVEIYNSTIPGRMVTADTESVSIQSRMAWFEEHSPGRRPLWVVELENAVIGWVSFQSFYGRPAYDATAEISIYLDEAVRGKGFGEKILQHAIERSAAFGIKTLLGFIFSHNEPSLHLFRKCGFQDWALLPDIAVLDGVERSLIIVGKRLT